MEIKKEWVRDPVLDLTRMKQLADRTDTLFFNNRGGRTVESHLGAPSDQSRSTPMTLGSMKTIFDRFKYLRRSVKRSSTRSYASSA
jgi:hypothetical protein